MIHQPTEGSQGQASEVHLESEELMHFQRQVQSIYAYRKLLTNKSMKVP